MIKENKKVQQGIETRNKIVEKSIELINEYGYDNISVNQICKTLGLTVGAFYHHFKTKEDIILEIMKYHDYFFEDESDRYLTAETTYENILIYLSLLPKRITNDTSIDVTRVLYCAVLNSNDSDPLSNERPISQKLIKLIEKAQENGEIKRKTPAIQIQEELLIVLRGVIFNWAESKGAYDLEKKANIICSNYLKFYKK